MAVFKKLIVYKTSKKGHSSHTHFTYLRIHSLDVVYPEPGTNVDTGLTETGSISPFSELMASEQSQE